MFCKFKIISTRKFNRKSYVTHSVQHFISERELTLTFAICYRRSVCLSVCNVGAPYSAG